MSTTDAYNPVNQPSMLYPQFGNLKPTKRFYQCPKCKGNASTHLRIQIQKSEEMVFGFQCHSCGGSWFISSRLILNSIFEDELTRLAEYTRRTGREFGGLIIKTSKGIRIDMVAVGEELSVSFGLTHPLDEGEEMCGTIHNHPITNLPSDWDIATFLSSSWEKVSIVNGFDGVINVLVKTKETPLVTDVMKWAKENSKLDLKEKGNLFKFMVFRGRINNLQLINNIGRDLMPVTSIERLLMGL